MELLREYRFCVNIIVCVALMGGIIGGFVSGPPALSVGLLVAFYYQVKSWVLEYHIDHNSN